MYTFIRHEPRHARKAWLGTLMYPCLLSGSDDYSLGLVSSCCKGWGDGGGGT
jgi:hypothetical protein